MGLNPEITDELIHRGFESPDLDYKKEFDSSKKAWMDLTKDVCGMANYGGGYVVFGVEDGTFSPTGLDIGFHKDTQEWIDRISKWVTGNLNLSYEEYVKNINGQDRKFPIIFVNGSVGSFLIPKIDGKYKLQSGEERLAFRQGVLYTRKNTSTIAASGNEYWELFWALSRRTAEKLGSTGTPLEVIPALSKKAEPDIVEETLWFNLFPVVEIPDNIYVADTECRYPTEIYEVINNKENSKGQTPLEIPSFLLEDKKIYSFSPFDETNPLRSCVDLSARRLFCEDEFSAVSVIPTKEWFQDESKHQKLIKLLNFNLKDLCRKKGFHYDNRKDRYYKRYYGGRIPEITWKPYQKTSTRQLVYPRINENTGKLVYCEHFAGRLRFAFLGEGIYLIIEPIRVLTQDGVEPLDQRRNVHISTKKNFYYHNNNYLYDMKLWLHILAGTREKIHLGYGQDKIIIDISPINAKVNFGILDDQYTSEDFLDNLRSEPFEYDIEYEEEEESNPLTETTLED
jgi:hypothetical protein